MRKTKASKQKSKRINDALKTEKKVAKKRRCKHQGGPNKPDFVCPDGREGEVKDRKTKVTKPELQRYAQQGIKIVHSTAGFTKEAVKYKKRYRKDMELCTPKECI